MTKKRSKNHNLRIASSMRGVKKTAEHRKKMSEARFRYLAKVNKTV